MRRGKKGRAVIGSVMAITMAVALGCAVKSEEQEVNARNLVQAGDPNTSRMIGGYLALGTGAFRSDVENGKINLANSRVGAKSLSEIASFRGESGGHSSIIESTAESTAAALDVENPSLLFGMPFSLLNQSMIFGSVITSVSDKANVEMGNLKLTDLPPLIVMPKIRQLARNQYSLVLLNCELDCSSASEKKPLLEMPVVGVNAQSKLVILDLASLGKTLDLTAVYKNHPMMKKFKAKSSKTARFDYSQSTLVFDVEAHLTSTDSTASNGEADETVLVNRWYMKSAKDVNQNFVTRKASEGVGFFTTERNPESLIQRWDFDKRSSNRGIKYYIKNVPAQYRAGFEEAFKEWNDRLLPVIGKKVFDYEFVPENDPRNELLVSGDVRYNIIEWDLINKASYGGLGPSIAYQKTGEIVQGSVLVQGPTIVELYTKWFNVKEVANNLRAEGRDAEAEQILAEASKAIHSELANQGSVRFTVKLGDAVEMRVRTQDPSLEDPILAKEEFDIVPEGYSYEQYMMGYFREMLAHELGHNLGLRHNFKGSNGALDDTNVDGGVSRSIMEYLGRAFRHHNMIGEYDLMAISYGYMGIIPQHTNWFCTDEDKSDLRDTSRSAECSAEDGTNDPFGYLQSRLNRAASLLVGRGHVETPAWTVEELKAQLGSALNGLGAYAASAEETSKTWTNFFGKADRPNDSAGVRQYVLGKVKAVLCDASLTDEINGKSTPEAREKAAKNVAELRTVSATFLRPVFSAEELACGI